MPKKGYKNYWSRKTVRSGLEARIKKDLEERNISFGYETEKLKYEDNICPHCGKPTKHRTYTPDFIIKRNSGRTLYVESKGRLTSSDRTKMLNVQRCNSNKDIRFVFQRDQCIRKGSTTKYSDWAIKHGFKYCVGEKIPQKWIDET